MKLKVESRTGHKELDVTLTESPVLEIVPFERAKMTVSAQQLAFRTQWLGSKAVHRLPELKKYCPVCQRALPFEYEHCPYDGSDLGIVPGTSDAKAATPSRPR